jgi:arylformamidase
VTDLEREYSPSSRVGGSSAPFVADYERRSEVARRELGDRVRALPGGSLFAEARLGAPLLVFVHGGYWQALSAAASLYLAPAALTAGWSYAAVEYTIAPEGSLPQMVHEVAEALGAIAAVAGECPLVLAGHSAGAHLAAMVSLAAVAPVPVRRTVLVSGVFDLRPLVHTTVNDALGLDLSTAMLQSPMLMPVVGAPEVVVTWGDNDTDAFRAQGTTYAAVVRSAGRSVTMLEREGRHHFDIVDELVDPASPLGAATLGGVE